MSRKRRQDYIGCSIVERRGRFDLQARPRGEDGRKQLKRWPTGLSAEGDEGKANHARLEPLAKIVGACIRAGRTRAEVDAVLAPALGTPTAASEPLSLGPTVRGYYETWIAEQTPLVDPALAHSYRGHFNRYILPTLGDLPLESLRPKDMRGLQADLLARKVLPRKKQKPTGKTLAVKTVKNVIVGSFAAFIRQARGDELVACDLFAGLKWPRVEHPEPDPFTLEEVRRICEWFRDHRFGFPPLPGSRGIRRLPYPAFHAYVHALFWTGLRPSEASGLQMQDLDLAEGALYVRRSYHRYGYHPPKTRSARRRVELFSETVHVLRDLLPLHVTPDLPVFTTTAGQPIEPKTFSDHWYDCLRSLGLRVRGLYCTKDTYVSHALQKVGSIEWVEQQTGVAYATLKRHYAKWLPSRARVELQRFANAIEAEEVGIDVQESIVGTSIPVTAGMIEENRVRGGGLEPPRVLPH
jgi:integrase